MKYTLYKILKIIVKPLFILIYNPKYINLENIPLSGGVILAGNHTSPLDALLMIGGPKRVVHMLAKKELFNTKIKRIFFEKMACISVDRSIHDKMAVTKSLDVLNNNHIVGIFPEGTINRTKDIIMPFKYGAVSFAKKANVPIVPFAIVGKYKKRNIKIIYGKPYKVSGNLEMENKKLMDKVTMLIKEGEKYE